jgi:type III restriction enzyme
LPERKHLAIRFPLVEGYVLDLQNNFITADVASIQAVTIQPIITPNEVFVQPRVGIKFGHVASQSFTTEKLDRQAYYEGNHLQTIQFEIARQIVMRLTETSQSGRPNRPSRYLVTLPSYRIMCRK